MTARRIVAVLALTVAAMLTAPTAAADPQCTDVAQGTTRCSNPGNVQINTAPTQTGPYLPAYCDPNYGALCDDGISISLGPVFGGGGHHGGGGRR